MLPALSSISNSPLKIVFIVLGVAAIVLWWLLKRGARKTWASTSSWNSYIGGQGTLLFGFLLLGGVLAWISSYGGPHSGEVTLGKLIAYHVDPSKEVLIEELDSQNYNRITVLTQTAEPQDGAATITIYGQSTGLSRHEIGRIETVAGAWSRWEQQNSSKRLAVTIATGAGARPATRVDVFVFLSSK